MALKKEIVKDNGVTTNYHRITMVGFNVSENGKTLNIALTSYLNEDYRANDKEIEQSYYTFALTDEDNIECDVRKLGYSKLKELDEWQDAEDC